jgi:hypothetical protein
VSARTAAALIAATLMSAVLTAGSAGFSASAAPPAQRTQAHLADPAATDSWGGHPMHSNAAG